MKFRIGSRTILPEEFSEPYIIAEAGVNHEGDLDKAKLMIAEAAEAGADAVKFQAYKADKIAVKDSPAYWDLSKEHSRTQYELFRRHDLFSSREFEELAEFANDQSVDFLVTPFDNEAVDFLDPLVPAFKIASADITNKPLIKHIAKKGKPILLSTGATSMAEIVEAVTWIREEGVDQIALLHCVLSYPTDYDNAVLGTIQSLRSTFKDLVIGYSDHTLRDRSEDVLIVAWLLGAQIIEKHFTWNTQLPGNDHYHAIDQEGLRRVVEKIRFAKSIIGGVGKDVTPNETGARLYARRSLVASRKIMKGEVIMEDDVVAKRPGTGIPPSMIEIVVGGTALENIDEDEILTFQKVRLSLCKSKLTF